MRMDGVRGLVVDGCDHLGRASGERVRYMAKKAVDNATVLDLLRVRTNRIRIENQRGDQFIAGAPEDVSDVLAHGSRRFVLLVILDEGAARERAMAQHRPLRTHSGFGGSHSGRQEGRQRWGWQ